MSASAVNVDSQEGNVTIHGKVKTADEKAKAETVARQVDGVKEVKNLLQVVPDAEKDVVKATDDSISNGVEAALQADRNSGGREVSRPHQIDREEELLTVP